MSEKLLLEDEKNFEILEDDVQEELAQKKNTRCCCWCGTWNNPTMSDDEFHAFLIKLENEGVLKYAIFQRERGEKTGTIHFQFFVDFKSPVRFTKVKSTLPYGSHFKPMISTKTRCSNYCSKDDTRVSGPYEVGELIEERQRTDLDRAIKLIDDGFSLSDVEEMFPKQSFMYSRLFKDRFWSRLNKLFGNSARNIEVTFIYGPPGTGKTTYVNSQVESLEDVFRVDDYGPYWFTGYFGQNVILLDEFVGQVKIPKLNKLCDPFPQKMNIKGGVVPACFSKIFIISNLPLEKLYKDDQEDEPVLYKAFCRRINKIVHFTEIGKFVVERDTIWEDVPPDEVVFKGLTRRAKQVLEYVSGFPRIVYDRDRNICVQNDLLEVQDDELPF